jgi:hypothetical protein
MYPHQKNTQDLTAALSYHIAKDMMPFQTVERPGFLRLMKVAVPHYKVSAANCVSCLFIWCAYLRLCSFQPALGKLTSWPHGAIFNVKCYYFNVHVHKVYSAANLIFCLLVFNIKLGEMISACASIFFLHFQDILINNSTIILITVIILVIIIVVWNFHTVSSLPPNNIQWVPSHTSLMISIQNVVYGASSQRLSNISDLCSCWFWLTD